MIAPPFTVAALSLLCSLSAGTSGMERASNSQLLKTVCKIVNAVPIAFAAAVIVAPLVVETNMIFFGFMGLGLGLTCLVSPLVVYSLRSCLDLSQRPNMQAALNSLDRIHSTATKIANRSLAVFGLIYSISLESPVLICSFLMSSIIHITYASL